MSRLLDFSDSSRTLAHDILNALFASRPKAGGHLPVEFSVQVHQGSLGRALRCVEYAAQASEHRAELCRAQRSRAANLMDVAGRATYSQTCTEFLQLCERGQGDALEVSYGLSVQPDHPRADLQVYAHVDPTQSLDALLHVLSWAGASSAHESLSRWARRSGARLHLVAWAPMDHDVKRVKLYFDVASSGAVGGNQPPPAMWGRLAPFVGKRTLAVAQASSRGLLWVKWDASVRPHFQQSMPLERTWVEGVCADDRERAAALFSGADFVVWPTWLSVGTGADAGRATHTLYFIPR
jgi:hypothetical protein